MGLYDSLSTTATQLLTRYGLTWQIGSPARSVSAVRIQRDEHRVPTGIFNLGSDAGAENGDIKFILNAAAVPQYGERMTDGTETFVVMSIDPIKPADTVIAYLIKARTG